MKKCFFITMITLLVITSIAVAKPKPRTYEVHALKEAPVMDGETERDAVWDSIPFATDFVPKDPSYPKDKETKLRMGITEDALYIGISCMGGDVDKLTSRAKDGDVGICSDDSIEMFIWPKGADTYYHFMIGANGARWNGRDIFAGEMPLGDWETAVFKENRYFSIEIKIPFSHFGVVPEKGEAWTGNVCRNVVLGDGRRGACWCEQIQTYHDTERFGKLVFVDSVTSPEAKAKRRKEIIAETEKWLTEINKFNARLSDLQKYCPQFKSQIAQAAAEYSKISSKLKSSSEAEFADLQIILDSSKKLFHRVDELTSRMLKVKLVDSAKD